MSVPRADAEPRQPERELTPARVLLALVVGYVVFKVRIVVEVGFVAVLYATLIERPVRSIARLGVPRSAAILLVDVGLVALLLAPVLLVSSAATREVHQFRREEPARLRTIDADWSTSNNAFLRGPGRRLVERAIDKLEHPPAHPPASTVVAAATRGFRALIAVLACLALAFFYLREKQLWRRLLLDNVRPDSRASVDRLWDEIEASIAGWFRSRLVLGLIVGVVTIVAFGALGLPYWALLGVLAGITEPIPILGPWIGGIPAVFLALTISPLLAVGVALFILGRQFVVDAVLVPRVTNEAVGLSPMTVFLAVIAGTELLGPIGALLAIPIAAAIQIIVADRLAMRRPMADAPRWAWLRADRPTSDP